MLVECDQYFTFGMSGFSGVYWLYVVSIGCVYYRCMSCVVCVGCVWNWICGCCICWFCGVCLLHMVSIECVCVLCD